MSAEAWITLSVVALLLIALIRDIAPADFLFLGAVAVLTVLGVLPPKEAFSGFSNSAVLTVAALFVVAAALRETGALEVVGRRVLGGAKTERQALLRTSGFVTTLSAFLNNTPVVAMSVPIVLEWCRRRSVSPSRLLIPVSYLAILGGMCTLIGTSTNLVVQGMLRDRGAEFATAAAALPAGSFEARMAARMAADLRPMHLFEITLAGVPLALAGVAYLLLVSRRLLPERKELLEQLGDARREYMVEMLVQPGCGLIGQAVESAGLRQLPGLFLIEIDRADQVITPVDPEEVLRANDRLVFAGVVTTIVDLERIPGLVPAADAGYVDAPHLQRGRQLTEVVISPSSPLIGRTIRDANFRAQYNAAIVAVHRNGERITTKIGDIVLHHGDTLLLQTGPHFDVAHRNNPDFYLVSAVADSRPLRRDKMWLSLGLLLATIVAMSVVKSDFGAIAVLFGAGLMIATRCISMTDARQSVEWSTLVMIAAALGVGLAMERSGAVAALTEPIVRFTQPLGPVWTLAAIYFATMVLNEAVTNNAAAALMFPFCIEIARLSQVSPRPFVMAVCLAASASFASPIGYQTHMMVYGPGGYRFSDFVRIGVPLNLLLWIIAVAIVPMIWPFQL